MPCQKFSPKIGWYRRWFSWFSPVPLVPLQFHCDSALEVQGYFIPQLFQVVIRNGRSTISRYMRLKQCRLMTLESEHAMLIQCFSSCSPRHHCFGMEWVVEKLCWVHKLSDIPLYHNSDSLAFFVCRSFFFYSFFFFPPLSLLGPTHIIAIPHGVSKEAPRPSSIILALHIHSWVLFYLSFDVYVLIYSPASLILKWENIKFFCGLDRYSITPLPLVVSFSLLASLVEISHPPTIKWRHMNSVTGFSVWLLQQQTSSSLEFRATFVWFSMLCHLPSFS